MFLWRQYTKGILYCILVYAIEMTCRLGFSVLLQVLFEAVSQEMNVWEKRRAYLLALACGGLWFTGQIARNNAFYEVPILSGKMRSELLFIIYTKLSRISLYSAKQQEVGKIINMLSNDFNTFEIKSPVFFASTIAPFALIAILAILITRFGWPGTLVFAVFQYSFPFKAVLVE